MKANNEAQPSCLPKLKYRGPGLTQHNKIWLKSIIALCDNWELLFLFVINFNSLKVWDRHLLQGFQKKIYLLISQQNPPCACSINFCILLLHSLIHLNILDHNIYKIISSLKFWVLQYVSAIFVLIRCTPWWHHSGFSYDITIDYFMTTMEVMWPHCDVRNSFENRKFTLKFEVLDMNK